MQGFVSKVINGVAYGLTNMTDDELMGIKPIKRQTMTTNKQIEEQIIKEWKKDFGDDFKLWSELGWWVQKYHELQQQTQKDTLDKVREIIGKDEGVISKDAMGNDIEVFNSSDWHNAQNKLRAELREKLNQLEK